MLIETTSNVTLSVDVIFMLSIFRTYESDILLPRVINWNVLGLAFKGLILNQFKTFFRSYTKFWNITERFLLQLYKVLSSAKLQTWDRFINRNKSFMKILKSRGPSMDPSGTLVITSYHALTDEPIFVLCLRLLRLLRISFKLFLVTPFECNLAISSSWEMQS